MAALTALGRREEEARRIAREEGFPIIEHDAVWESFMLDDPLQHPLGTLHTAFSWNGWRFEGFVTFAQPEITESENRALHGDR